MRSLCKRIANPTVVDYFQRYRLILLSLSLGLACLFILMYSNHLVRHETARRFHSQGADLFSIIPRPDRASQAASRRRPLQIATLNLLKQDSSFVIHIAPESNRLDEVRYHDFESQLAVIGIFPEYRAVFDLQVERGRFFSELDSAASFCIIGNHLWKRWARNAADSLLGATVQVGRQVCTVIGVLAPAPTFSGEYRPDEAVFMPYYAMMQFNTVKSFSKVTLAANPSRTIEETADYIQSRLTRLMGDISAYEISNQALFAHTIAQRMKLLSIVVGSLASVLLWFGGRQLLLTLRLEKSMEGVEESRKKMASLLQKAWMTGLLTSIGGVLIGMMVSWIISSLYHWSWRFAGLSFPLTLLIGCLLAGLIGWRAQMASSS